MSMQILKSICTPPGDLRCPGDRLQYNFERYFGSRRNPVLYPIGTWPSKFSRECMIEWEEHIRGCKHSATNTVLPDTTTSRERWGRPDRNTGSEMDPAQQSMLVEEFRSVTSSSHETARELLQVSLKHTFQSVNDPAASQSLLHCQESLPCSQHSDLHKAPPGRTKLT